MENQSERDQFIYLYQSERNGGGEYKPFNCDLSKKTCWNVQMNFAMNSENCQFIWLYDS